MLKHKSAIKARRVPRVPHRAALLLLVALTACWTATPAHAAAPRTAIWVGSPVDGTFPSNADSHPSRHHTFNWGERYAGDFGLDVQNVASRAAVYLYAAPQNTAYNNQIRAKVERVVATCASPNSAGSTVVVGLYHNNTRSGTVTFAHVTPSVSGGTWISRWGSQIGTVGDGYGRSSCWSARHLHMEMMSDANYACYNRGWNPGQRMYRMNFVGYVGGSFATAIRRPCP